MTPEPQVRSWRAAACALMALAMAMGMPGDAWSGGRVLAALERPALQVARPAQAVLLTVTRAGDRLLACGEHGLVIYSDDSGKNWTQVQVPVSVTLTAMRFKNEREGWAVGNMGVVLRTRDAGMTWERLFDGRAAAALVLQSAQAAWNVVKPDANELDNPLNVSLESARRLVAEGADKPFLDLMLRPDGALLVAGAYGLAFSSADGGHRWQPDMDRLSNPDGFTIYGLVARQQELFVFGEQGLLLHAAGPNEPFKAQPFPSTGSLFGAVALRQGPLLLLGLRGKVFRSSKPGDPWVAIQTPVDASLFAGLQLSDDSVLLVGAAGQVLISRDQGQTFSTLPMKTRFPFTGATVAPDGSLVLAGTRGLLRLDPAVLAMNLGPHKAQVRNP